MTALETLYREYQRGACEWCGKGVPHDDELVRAHEIDITDDGGEFVECTALDFTRWADQHVAALTERAERAEKDAARLDWLQGYLREGKRHGQMTVFRVDGPRDDLRAALDRMRDDAAISPAPEGGKQE